MATMAPVQKEPESTDQNELDRLAGDFFSLAESQLETMPPEKRGSVVASIHATAKSLRAKR